jgi:alpha-galactosidase
MAGTLKIVLIGAGSREFSKGLVHDLVLERSLLEARSLRVVMVDVDSERLQEMHGYAQRCAAAMKAPIVFEAATDRRAALKNADFVLVSVATKRMELWEQDFRVPLAFGVPHVYGENGGPGAAFHALRNFQIVLPICHDVEEVCPDAWILNFTNPEARILTAMLTLTRVKAIGLCHGFYSFRRLAEAVLSRPLAELDVRTAGINHFYTYYRIAEKLGGRDLVPEFEKLLDARAGELPPLVRYLWKTFGALGYVSDHHVGEYVGFAHEFMDPLWLFGIEGRPVQREEKGVDGRTVFEAWRRGVDVATYLSERLADKERDELSGQRPLRETDIKPSGELAVPVIADMTLDRKAWRESVNVMNTGGFIENLDRDTAVELPATVNKSGVHPDHVGRLPEGFASLIRQQQMVQRLLVQAYKEGSRKLLLQSLLLDPCATTLAREVEQMMDHMLKIQSAYLPHFS